MANAGESCGSGKTSFVQEGANWHVCGQLGQAPYFERIISSGESRFADLVAIRSRIEQRLKDDKIPSVTGTFGSRRKFYGNF